MDSKAEVMQVRRIGGVMLTPEDDALTRPETPLGCDPAIRLKRLERRVRARNSHQPEFLQAVEEVSDSLRIFLSQRPEYITAFEAILEPERTVTFRVPWFDDAGMLIFKNSLTGLQIGGGKGGSDFDPKGKSVAEIRRFCQSFMTELYRHIGPSRDVPAGDIGVGTREIGFMFGQYKRLSMNFEGALTGKALGWGGSEIRPEATGYGCAYFAESVCNKFLDASLKGKVCSISGCGNVAIYCAQKLQEMGAIVVTLSDSSGCIHAPDGLSKELVERIREAKQDDPSTRVSSFADGFGVVFHPKRRPWSVACEIAFPCATQNEVDEADALALIGNGCKIVVEGANMPLTPQATAILRNRGVIICPAKAANAGGVAVSGLEMTQNAGRVQWSRKEVDDKLRSIMASIFEKCCRYAEEYAHDSTNLITGANIAGFVKVADAVAALGYV